MKAILYSVTKYNPFHPLLVKRINTRTRSIVYILGVLTLEGLLFFS